MDNFPNKLFLSRRNLQTLLNKLDRKAAGGESACAIIKYRNMDDPAEYKQDFDEVMIIAVEDSDFYRIRTPGMVLPADEPIVRDMQDPR